MIGMMTQQRVGKQVTAFANRDELIPLTQREVAIRRAHDDDHVHEEALKPGRVRAARDFLLVRDDAVAGGPNGRQQRGHDGQPGRRTGPYEVSGGDVDRQRVSVGEHQEGERLADDLGH